MGILLPTDRRKYNKAAKMVDRIEGEGYIAYSDNNFASYGWKDEDGNWVSPDEMVERFGDEVYGGLNYSGRMFPGHRKLKRYIGQVVARRGRSRSLSASTEPDTGGTGDPAIGTDDTKVTTTKGTPAINTTIVEQPPEALTLEDLEITPEDLEITPTETPVTTKYATGYSLKKKAGALWLVDLMLGWVDGIAASNPYSMNYPSPYPGMSVEETIEAASTHDAIAETLEGTDFDINLPEITQNWNYILNSGDTLEIPKPTGPLLTEYPGLSQFGLLENIGKGNYFVESETGLYYDIDPANGPLSTVYGPNTVQNYPKIEGWLESSLGKPSPEMIDAEEEDNTIYSIADMHNKQYRLNKYSYEVTIADVIKAIEGKFKYLFSLDDSMDLRGMNVKRLKEYHEMIKKYQENNPTDKRLDNWQQWL